MQGPNYIAERATLAVTVDGRPYTTLQPERRLFTVQRRQVAETAIHTNLLRDLYATLGEGDAQQRLGDPPLSQSAGALDLARRRARARWAASSRSRDRRLRIGAPVAPARQCRRAR